MPAHRWIHGPKPPLKADNAATLRIRATLGLEVNLACSFVFAATVGLLAAACTDERPPQGSDSDSLLDSAASDSGAANGAETGDADALAVELSARLHEENGTLVYVSWQQLQQAPTWVEYSFDEEQWLRSPTQDREAGSWEQLLLGIPYGAQLRYRLAGELEGETLRSAEGAIDTAEQPDELPAIELLTSQPELQEPSAPWFLASINETDTYYGGPWRTIIIDRQGRYVWSHSTPNGYITLQPRPSSDGSGFLADRNSGWAQYDKGEASHVSRFRIDGSELAEYATPGLMHSFTETADGSIVWGSDPPYESLVELSPEGEQRTIWSSAEFLKKTENAGYCSSNTIFWVEEKDSFLFSFFTNNSVVEVDRASGETLRWFGQLDGAWSFSPPGSAFWWQHGTSYTDEGHLLLSATIEYQGDETVIREYALDEETQTLRQVWSYGEGLGLFSHSHSDARRLPNGNTLHNLGSTPRLREITPEAEVAWDISWGMGLVLGIATPIEDLYAFAP